MREHAGWLLLVLGLLKMAGDATGIVALQGVGAASGASPAPKVFSAVQGFETYSSRFLLEWRAKDGTDHRVALTPELSSRLRGPYNRRNVYGAALAYGPVLASSERTRPLFESVLRHGLCGKAPLLRELGIDPRAVDGLVSVHVIPLEGAAIGNFPDRFTPDCEP